MAAPEELELLQRRVEELIALLAIYGDQITVESLDPPELLVAVQEGCFEARTQRHLARHRTHLTLAVSLPPPPPPQPPPLDFGSSMSAGAPAAAAAAAAGPWQACLHAVLPPGYPCKPPQLTAVTCVGLSRGAEAGACSRLQQLADGAAGEECLYQLVDALVENVQQQLAEQQWQQQEQPAAGRDGCALGGRSRTAAATAAAATAPRLPAAAAAVEPTGGGSGAGAGSSGGSGTGVQGRQGGQRQVALLRLDHMHARTTYSRTIRRWAGELGLGARLLFCGPLILILLEGEGEGIRQYLVRQRTQNVDVDSRGRPCRERMMDVICIQPAAHCTSTCGSTHNNSSSSNTLTGSRSGGKGLTSAGTPLPLSPQPPPPLLSDFREQEVNVGQLAALLRQAGLHEHWAAATGLPPPREEAH